MADTPTNNMLANRKRYAQLAYMLVGKIVEGRLVVDVPCKSFSEAAMLVWKQSMNGWEFWKDSDEKPVSHYRSVQKNI